MVTWHAASRIAQRKSYCLWWFPRVVISASLRSSFKHSAQSFFSCFWVSPVSWTDGPMFCTSLSRLSRVDVNLTPTAFAELLFVLRLYQMWCNNCNGISNQRSRKGKTTKEYDRDDPSPTQCPKGQWSGRFVIPKWWTIALGVYRKRAPAFPKHVGLCKCTMTLWWAFLFTASLQSWTNGGSGDRGLLREVAT